MSPIKAELSLFVREDEDLSTVNPKFTRREIGYLTVSSEHYNIFGDLDGEGGTRYSIKLPQSGLEISVCRAGPEHQYFYGGYVALINEYIKDNPTAEATKWITANARELNIAKHYWDAVALREQSLELQEQAKSAWLKANLSILDAKAYADGKWGLTKEERNLAMAEYGYSPEDY